jgi:hypothetical protein
VHAAQLSAVKRPSIVQPPSPAGLPLPEPLAAAPELPPPNVPELPPPDVPELPPPDVPELPPPDVPELPPPPADPLLELWEPDELPPLFGVDDPQSAIARTPARDAMATTECLSIIGISPARRTFKNGPLGARSRFVAGRVLGEQLPLLPPLVASQERDGSPYRGAELLHRVHRTDGKFDAPRKLRASTFPSDPGDLARCRDRPHYGVTFGGQAA